MKVIIVGGVAGGRRVRRACAGWIALGDLYAKSPSAKTMGEKAIGILVFPGIVKGGFIVGGQYGEGALIKDGKAVAYYNTVAASYGLQAGL
jgi:lipid-binding SYLF domain-containing protein